MSASDAGGGGGGAGGVAAGASGLADFDGRERAPMRLAEARTPLAVIRAREGNLDEAVTQGSRALGGGRKSLPSLLVVSRDLTKVLRERYPAETETRDYLDQLATLTAEPVTS